MVIYKTTNLVNLKIYVGKDSKNDPNYFGSGLYLERAIKKYGKKNFKKEILERCLTLEQLNDREKYWIKILNSNNRKVGYNLTDGGDGGDTTKQHPKRKELHAKFMVGGRRFWKSPEGKRLHAKLLKKRWADPKFRNQMVDLMSNRKITWKDKISDGLKEYWKTASRSVSEETKKKLSEASKGRELVILSNDIKNRILELYKTIGCCRIRAILKEEFDIDVSRYVINRVLKTSGIYRKYQKGLNEN